ncbi:UNVERIFIED_CONTAM: putative protein phosphatase 2C 40 [Sesamum angustifolium]|uniref:PPM-type phosphatase domain-containing protein n=1 Tax=Sesamum angustifolium TaxID=2727405 RepID=A0AAW2LW55_9LAMI
MMLDETINASDGEIKVSFGYNCNSKNDDSYSKTTHIDIPSAGKLRRASRSFSCLSGAALSANATLANTNICNGLIGAEILPTLDSPTSFRRVPSSPSLTKIDLLSASFQNSMSNLSFSPHSPRETLDFDAVSFKPSSVPTRSESFLNAMEVLQIAGGAAGEDRVQAVCSEENGWLFCAVYDGFNGRDAADFLAGTLYETVAFHLNLLDWDLEEETLDVVGSMSIEGLKGDGSFSQSVLESLERALGEAENEFLQMVEQEMEERPDLVSIGSCVLLVLLHGNYLYLLNIGDSRAVLATYDDDDGNMKEGDGLRAVQLTESHTVDNDLERIRLLNDHPDDPSTIVGWRVKGKLKKNERCFDGNSSSGPNNEVVTLVHSYILRHPSGDPAKYLVEQLVGRAADSAGFSMEELMSIPAGRRRKYHDDVTVIVIILGNNNRTSKASTCL